MSSAAAATPASVRARLWRLGLATAVLGALLLAQQFLRMPDPQPAPVEADAGVLPPAPAPAPAPGTAQMAAADDAPSASGDGARTDDPQPPLPGAVEPVHEAPPEPAAAPAAPPQPAPVVAAEPPPAPLPADAWLIQLGVFADTANAESLRAGLAAQGHPARLQSRVVLGPYENRKAAEAAMATLRKQGQPAGIIVAPRK